MKRRIVILSAFLLMAVSGMCQQADRAINKTNFFFTGGIGTSWILLPKVFLVDVDDLENNWQILPANNKITGYVGFMVAMPLSKHWLFTPEIDISFTSGEIRVDALKPDPVTQMPRSAQRSQQYTRIEVPLNFGVLSSDNFWVSFGPVVNFTIQDNKGFEEAAFSLITNPEVKIDSDIPFGLGFRLAAYVGIERFFVNVKFQSDLFRSFKFEDGVYDMRMSMQSITLGMGWRTTKER